MWVLASTKMVEVRGIEPLAPCLQSRCSPAELHPHGAGEEQDPRVSRISWSRYEFTISVNRRLEKSRRPLAFQSAG